MKKKQTEAQTIVWLKEKYTALRADRDQQAEEVKRLERVITDLYDFMHTFDGAPAYTNWPNSLWYDAASIANE